MKLVKPGILCLLPVARSCVFITVLTLLSCETPPHLQHDFGVSYREAIRIQTDRDHVRRSVAGSTLDGRAAASLYEGYIERYRPTGDTARQSDAMFSQPAAWFFQGSPSNQTGSMPTSTSTGEPTP